MIDVNTYLLFIGAVVVLYFGIFVYRVSARLMTYQALE